LGQIRVQLDRGGTEALILLERQQHDEVARRQIIGRVDAVGTSHAMICLPMRKSAWPK